MGYKFQLGDATLSGSLTQEGDIIAQSGGDPTKGVVSASLGLRLPTAGTLVIGETVNLAQADLAKIDGITNGTVAAGKAVVVDASKDADGFRNLSASALIEAGNITAGVQVAAATLSASAGLQLKGGLVIDGGASTISDVELLALDSITPGTVSPLKAVVVSTQKDADGFRNLSASALIECADVVAGVKVAAATLSASAGLQLKGGLVINGGAQTISDAELLTIDGVTAGTVSAGKAVVVDSSKDADGFRNLSASALIECADVEAGIKVTAPVISGSGIAIFNAVQIDSANFVSATRQVTATQLSSSGQVQLDEGDLMLSGEAVTSTAAELNLVDGFAEAVYTRAADSILFFDANDNKFKRESNDDFLTAIAGAGLTVVGNQLQADGAAAPQGFGNVDALLVVGFNFGTAALTGTAGANWRLPAAPSNGDVVRVKAPANIGTSFINITAALGGVQTVEGQASIRLESPGAAVSLIYVGNNAWLVF